MTSGTLIVLAAGGTGGHVFPAEALAAELLRRGYRLALVTDRRGKAYGGTLGELTTYRIRAGGLAGRGIVGLIKGGLDLLVGLFQARSLLKRLQPAAVIGFGGYAAFPTVTAAQRLRIPAALHEQNAVLGRANRAVAKGCRRVATSYPTVRFLDALSHRAILTGMPVRPAVAAMRSHAYQAPLTGGPLRLLVLGGSQGARILSEVIPAALARLPADLRERLHVAQQCRPEDLEVVRAAYAGTGIDAELESFFSDVPERLADAHLVICRSGASTMAELTTIGRPALLVPYPHAIDDHQTANGEALAAAGGAILMPQSGFTPEALAARLASLLIDPGALADMAARALAAGHPEAAARLADLIAELAGAMTTEVIS